MPEPTLHDCLTYAHFGLIVNSACMVSGGRRNPFGRQAVRAPPKPFRAKEAGELGLPVGKDRNDPAVITLNTHRCVQQLGPY